MELPELFLQATVDSKALTEKPDNETLLKLYAFFKQASEGNTQEDGPSNPFDFVAKFKYEAWAKLKGTTKEAAMQAYINLVNELKANQ